jgi:membrane protein DedA with SNARE-associated domain
MELAIAVLSDYGLLIIPALLLAGAVGGPFPEDLITVTAGYLAFRGVLPLAPALAVLMASIFLADSLMYWVGRTAGARFLGADKRRRLAARFDRWGVRLVFGSRFVFGTRGPVFLGAGALGVPFRRFLAADVLAGVLFIPGLFFFTYRSGERVDAILKAIEQGGAAAGWVLLALIAAGAAALFVSRRRAAKDESPST